MATHIYGSSGNVRDDFNAWIQKTHKNYKGNAELPEQLIYRGRTFATHLINAKLEVRYEDAIPWASGDVPEFIDEITNVLALEFCLVRLSRGPKPKEQDKVVEQAKECKEWLDQIAEGEMKLPELERVAEEVYFTHKNRTPACDVDPIENQGVDSRLLDDISDRRQ